MTYLTINNYLKLFSVSSIVLSNRMFIYSMDLQRIVVWEVFSWPSLAVAPIFLSDTSFVRIKIPWSKSPFGNTSRLYYISVCLTAVPNNIRSLTSYLTGMIAWPELKLLSLRGEWTFPFMSIHRWMIYARFRREVVMW